MNVAIIAAVIGAAATLVVGLVTILYYKNRDRHSDQRQVDLLYGQNKHELYRELRRLVEEQKALTFGAITIRSPIKKEENLSRQIGELVDDMKVTSPELYPLANSMKMTLLRAFLAEQDRVSPNPSLNNSSENDAYQIWTIADELFAALLQMMQFDLRGQLRNTGARSLMNKLESQYDFAKLSLPPPPPYCWNPSVGVRNSRYRRA